MTTMRTHFTFRVDTWTPDGESIVEQVAGVEASDARIRGRGDQSGGSAGGAHGPKSARTRPSGAIEKKGGGSVPPEILEAVRREFGIAHRVLDVLVAEPSL
jgi:hypothetical protein